MQDERLWTVCELEYFPRNLKMRSYKTREQYRFAIGDMERYLGRHPMMSDLNDDVFVLFLKWLVDYKELAEITANERAGRIKSLWTWLARRGKVPVFPTIGRLAVPESPPLAWSEHELERLFVAAGEMRGMVGPFTAAAWWRCLLAWLWCTGERIGATLDMQWEHIDLDRGIASLPAKIRKQGLKPAIYRLWPDVVGMLRIIYRPTGNVFLWPFCRCTYWLHYNKLLALAGLPTGRKRKSHAMRVSHATWTAFAGGDATRALLHSDPATTKRHYLDVRFLPEPTVNLPRLWDKLPE